MAEKIPEIEIEREARKLGVDARVAVPEAVSANLRHEMFEWQREAMERLVLKWEVEKAARLQDAGKAPLHLMFNMATGTGKTLIMAAAMLHFYREGYRYFLFFVNRNNIVDKTEHNFCNPAHGKYLFVDNIVMDGKRVAIEKVEAFSDHPSGIEIKFTSIQKLHNAIHLQRENQTTLADLGGRDVVMLADEAHHLNADTRGQATLELSDSGGELDGKTAAAAVERRGWEHTVLKLILGKGGRFRGNRNVLLEFSATIPASAAVAEKYRDKLLYRFELKEFLRRGYTKEINLLSSSLSVKERVLLALLLQWYRWRVALKHGLVNFKPVALFRSRTIAESRADYEAFLAWMDPEGGIGGEDFAFVAALAGEAGGRGRGSPHEMGHSRVRQVAAFVAENGISYDEIARWIREAYAPPHVVITHSRGDKGRETTDADTDALLNSLEAPRNPIRAIFTVARLTEGWDVLNLFDIVRLYQGQNAAGRRGQTPEATVAEKQLIGRGVRYCPFPYGDAVANKRKFDDDMGHELRVLEELYYHTWDEESRYIWHLKAELRRDGYIADDRAVRAFKLKPAFVAGAFYNRAKIWVNKPVANAARRRGSLGDVVGRVVEVRVPAAEVVEEGAVDLLGEGGGGRVRHGGGVGTRVVEVRVGEMEKFVFDAALNRRAAGDALCKFRGMREVLDIRSMNELRSDKLADMRVRFVVEGGAGGYADIAGRYKLEAALQVVDAVVAAVRRTDAPMVGGEFGLAELRRVFCGGKSKAVEVAKCDEAVAAHEWYALDAFCGSSEEKALVGFVAKVFGNLREKYAEIYLLKNEEVYKIYDYAGGRGFCPDFILFLRGAGGAGAADVCYQVLIEPKGNQFKDFSGGFAGGGRGGRRRFWRRFGGGTGMRWWWRRIGRIGWWGYLFIMRVTRGRGWGGFGRLLSRSPG